MLFPYIIDDNGYPVLEYVTAHWGWNLMVQETLTAPVPESEAPVLACAHYWVIQPADGPFSTGSCRTCGETKDFKNYVESATWGDSRLNSRTDQRDVVPSGYGAQAGNQGYEDDEF